LADDDTHVNEIFAMPVGATDVNDVPAGWDAKLYRVAGWEKGSEGFGVIYYKDMVALAKFTRDDVGASDLESTISDYRDLFDEPVMVGSDKVKYYFWSTKRQRFMINVQYVGKTATVTEVLGDHNLMDALHMSPDAAKKDLASLSGKPLGAVGNEGKPDGK
jgi:hypothetical protein